MPGQLPFYARAVNVAGDRLRRAGWLSALEFEPLSLVRAARSQARLEDFGAPDPDEPLARLARATEDEARLTVTGRVAIRKYLVDLLVNRLQLQRERASAAQAPSPIERPLFIVGLPRTGTTLLHNLIARDPGVRVPLTWEVMFPSPAPRAAQGRADPRIARTQRALRWLERLAPDFKRIHPVGAELPQECIAITTHAFASIQFHTTQRVPAYQDWLERTGMREAYRCHREFLQHLQRHDPGRRWVLKAPGHLFALDALLAEYPDAVIVQTHRDPLRVVGSIASHGVVLRAAFSEDVDPHEVASDWSARWARALMRALAARDADPQAARRFLDLRYADVVRDPLAAVRAIYAHAEHALTPQAEASMRAYLAANPRDRHGVHRYGLEEFGLDPALESARYDAYCRRFAIAPEGPRDAR
jgi:hypothetical protein